MVVQAVQRFPHQPPDVSELSNNIGTVFAVVVFHRILHIERKGHIESIQPDLIGINLFVPEVAGGGARLS